MTLELDPEFKRVGGWLLEALKDSMPPPVGDWETRRTLITALMRRLSAGFPEHPEISRTEHRITAGDGTELSAFWYVPSDKPAVSAGVLFLHGGGMISGSVEIYDPLIAEYVARSRVPMLALDYRLAPEHPFPAPLEDAYAALCYLHRHAGELGIDPRRIGVMGDSAGGGLAAALTLIARERCGPSIAGQILIYPMLDDRTAVPNSQLEPFAFWSYNDNITAWGAILGDKAGSHELSAIAAPARCTDFTGLAPASIEVGALDIFRDESIRYASGLLDAGVNVELRVIAGAPHTYDWIAPSCTIAKDALAARSRALQKL